MTMQKQPISYQIFKKINVQYQAAGVDDSTESTTMQSLEHELAQCKLAESEWKNKFMHLSADFDNFKRRLSKEQATWAQDAQVALLSNILAIADDIDRALSHPISTDNQEIQTWLAGFSMIQKSMQDFLKKNGIQEVLYDIFDPHIHEALMEVDSAEHTSGHIVSVLQKGYRMGDRIIRPARVSVAR